MMRSPARVLACLAGASALMSGCSGLAHPPPDTSSIPPTRSTATTAARNATYASVVQLRDAAISAGLPCPAWEQGNAVKLAAESGTCSTADVLSTYTSESTRDEMVLGLKELMGSDYHLLVGPNWVINSPMVAQLEPSLGGVLVTG